MNPETFGSVLSTLQSNRIIDVTGLGIIDGDASLSREVMPVFISRKHSLTVVDQLTGIKEQCLTKTIAPGCARHRGRLMLIPLAELNQQMTEIPGVGIDACGLQ